VITSHENTLESFSNPQKTREVFQFAPKEKFWDLDLGFSVGVIRKRVGFAFFCCSFMMSSPGR